jgi:hypothetical protein
MISLTSNRPNITYATHPIAGLLSDFRNLQFLVPEHGNQAFDPKTIPKTIIFHDNLQEAANAANYLNSLLPDTMKNTQIIKHYHSKMSMKYLEQAFQDFASPDGTTRVLCATSGASTVCSQLLLFLDWAFIPFKLGTRRVRHPVCYSVWHEQRSPEYPPAMWPWWTRTIKFCAFSCTL